MGEYAECAAHAVPRILLITPPSLAQFEMESRAFLPAPTSTATGCHLLTRLQSWTEFFVLLLRSFYKYYGFAGRGAATSWAHNPKYGPAEGQYYGPRSGSAPSQSVHLTQSTSHLAVAKEDIRRKDRRARSMTVDLVTGKEVEVSLLPGGHCDAGSAGMALVCNAVGPMCCARSAVAAPEGIQGRVPWLAADALSQTSDQAKGKKKKDGYGTAAKRTDDDLEPWRKAQVITHKAPARYQGRR